MNKPTTQEIIDRLEELSDAVTKGRDGMGEFTMRVPAEPKRDADLVLSAAAMKLKELEAVIHEIIDDHDYGSPDAGNDEGMDKARKLIGWKPWGEREENQKDEAESE